MTEIGNNGTLSFLNDVSLIKKVRNLNNYNKLFTIHGEIENLQYKNIKMITYDEIEYNFSFYMDFENFSIINDNLNDTQRFIFIFNSMKLFSLLNNFSIKMFIGFDSVVDTIQTESPILINLIIGLAYLTNKESSELDIKDSVNNLIFPSVFTDYFILNQI